MAIKKYILTIPLLFFAVCLFGKVRPVSLKCQFLTNPEGVDMPSPRFFWKLTSEATDQYQTAYQNLVATSHEKLDQNIEDAFDSKKANDPKR